MSILTPTTSNSVVQLMQCDPGGDQVDDVLGLILVVGYGPDTDDVDQDQIDSLPTLTVVVSRASGASVQDVTYAVRPGKKVLGTFGEPPEPAEPLRITYPAGVAELRIAAVTLDPPR